MRRRRDRPGGRLVERGARGGSRRVLRPDGRAADIVVALGEVSRRQAYRNEGATSSRDLGRRALRGLGPERPGARPGGREGLGSAHLVGSLCAGEVSLDKVKVFADVATPESDRSRRGGPGALGAPAGRRGPGRRRRGVRAGQSPDAPARWRFVRFNEALRTMSVQLPAESYAETRACLEARAHNIPSEGRPLGTSASVTPSWSSSVRASPAAPPHASSPYVVVVHVALEALLDEGGRDEPARRGP